MKQAILLVSFGTANKDTRERTYFAIEQKVKSTFFDYFIYHGFTSEKIISKIEKRENVHIPNLKEALEQVLKDGIVASGYHVRKDMIGDQETSWKNQFRKKDMK